MFPAFAISISAFYCEYNINHNQTQKINEIIKKMYCDLLEMTAKCCENVRKTCKNKIKLG